MFVDRNTKFSDDVLTVDRYRSRLKIYDERLDAFARSNPTKENLTLWQKDLLISYWEKYDKTASIGQIFDYNRDYVTCLAEWAFQHSVGIEKTKAGVDAYIQSLELKGWAFIYRTTKCGCSDDSGRNYQCIYDFTNKYEWVILSPP